MYFRPAAFTSTSALLTRSPDVRNFRQDVFLIVLLGWLGVATFGALPFIYGTLVSSFLALLIAVPISLGTALFLGDAVKQAVILWQYRK